MPSNVVSYVSTEKNFLGVIISINQSYVDVPSLSDLESTNSRISSISAGMERKIATQDKNISKLTTTLESTDSEIKSNKLQIEQLQATLKEVISVDRLLAEKTELDLFFNDFLIKIQELCLLEYTKIHNEVEAFKAINLNEELVAKIQPIFKSLYNKDEINKMGEYNNLLRQLKTNVDAAQSSLDNFLEVKRDINSIHAKITVLHQSMINIQNETIANINNQMAEVSSWLTTTERKNKIQLSILIFCLVMATLGILI